MSLLEQAAWRRLCEQTELIMDAQHIPGTSVGIYLGGEVTAASFGVTSLENPLPVTPDTLFQIGSITKTFTCAATLKMVEAGRLELDDTVKSILPDFRVMDDEATEAATIWSLLTHTAGWLGDFFIDTGGGDDALTRYVARMSELPQVVPIGRHYSYNNAGFVLLGAVLERITGMSFHRLLHELILDPAGLHGCYLRAEDLMTRRFVAGHWVRSGQPGVATPWGMTRNGEPVGAIVANVGELLNYARLLLAKGKAIDGTRVLTSRSVEQMGAWQAPIWGETEAIGLAWHLDCCDGQVLLHHGGATTGQRAYLEFAPGRDFAVAILANADTGYQLTHAVRRQALREFLGIELPEKPPAPMPRAARREIEGRYVLPKLGYTDIRLQQGRLVCQDTNTGGFPSEDTPPEPPEPPYELAFCEADRLVVTGGKLKDTTCEVLRDQSGDMKWFRMGGRIHLREPLPGA
jgi:CubicO group peptidase (beta-lactamase class C family)